MTKIISYKKNGASRFAVVARANPNSPVHVNMSNAADGRPEFNVSLLDEKTGRVFAVELDAETSEALARMVIRGGGHGMNALRAKFEPQ